MKQSILTLSHVWLVIKTEKNIFQTMAKRHQMFMFLAYSQKSILEQKNPQCIRVQEKVMQNFSDTEQTKIRECLNVKNDESICIVKRLILRENGTLQERL